MTTRTGTTPKTPAIPLLLGVRPVSRARFPAEVVAGVTLAALAIPEVLGYAKIAGMPVVTGLYTMLIPLLVFAVFGGSRHLVVGADSATAAIMFAALSSMAAVASPEYVALAGMLALMAGGFLLLARILRLGFLAEFLSRTVLIGFLTGVGIQIACGQLAGMFGLSKEGERPLAQVYHWAADLGQTSLTTLAVSAAVLVVIVAGERLARRVPWPLIAVVGTIVASAALSLSSHGVATLGTVPRGLPSVSWPSVAHADFAALAAAAASIFVVILAQSAATSRAYAAKYDDAFDENVDLVGLGLANLSAGLTGTFVVNGSPTKTAMVDEGGGRTQLAQIGAAIVVLLVLLFLTKPLGSMPEAVLAAVVFLIGVKLVDVKGMREIYRLRRVEFGVAVVTAAVVVFAGVEAGIVVAIVLSIIAHLRHSYRPPDRLLVRAPSGRWSGSRPATGAQAAPGLAVYKFGSGLYYANAGFFATETLDVIARAEPPIEWFCLVAEAVIDVDYTATKVLRTAIEKMHAAGIVMVVSDVSDEVRAELDRDGLTELIGAENFFDDVDAVLEAYRARPGAPGGTA